ncbi:putative thiazole-containing bacteriocin maturation protein [Bacillus toyonensis]|uniref:putative thiazole-containing bacteriocin maturation protein n=1 Tax=Bacillus toyonensis TaxID=155322 RepID=UPI0021CEFEA1|nr:putative thiazole-containing bacteriocin maturation protein [Bacillus toyonensis]MCU5584215.1 putative thiazole-containing bacteriocin maturation protein [Bacillus toyonensis]
MQILNPSARLKMNRDTFFVIYPGEGVYFRNNFTSLRIEGNDIGQWIDTLIPVFDGTNTLEYISKELSESYRNKLYEIAQILYANGLARDVSKDIPHQLPDSILAKFSSQIEFLESVSDSGGYRFQLYRQTKVLLIGSGSLLVTLVLSLIKSGLPKFSMMITDLQKTDMQRIKEIVVEARHSQQEIEITTLTADKNSWEDILRPFDSILYGVIENDFNQLCLIEAICKEEMKTFLPVTILKDVAFVGPLVHSKSEACWKSAYCRLHKTTSDGNYLADSNPQTAVALLANMMVFEQFRKFTGLLDTQIDTIYLLHLETLEGSWHTFYPHPIVTRQAYAEPVKDPISLLEETKSKQLDLYSLFNMLTSKETGIFHIWEEEDLVQMPLSQCKIQVASSLSEGTTKLNPDMVCSGITHEEARREAGLVGIESYMRDFSKTSILEKYQLNKEESWGFGTGETAAEGLCRALKNWVDQEFIKQTKKKEIHVYRTEVDQIEDEACQYFLQTLYKMEDKPEIYLGHEVSGFPVIWVRSYGGWYGSPGLSLTMALRRALSLAIMNRQNKHTFRTSYGASVFNVIEKGHGPQKISFPFYEDLEIKNFISALQILERLKKQVRIFHLYLEEVFKEGTAGLYGLLVREEELN